MTDKAVDDWMAFYIGKYLADTMHLGREQHGSYLLLIMAAFKNAGWLPNDDGLLAQIAKCTPREWKAERATYARFFELTDERWTHAKVTKEWGKAQALTRQRSAAGTASAAKRERERNARSTDVEPPLVRNRRHLQSHLQEPVTTTESGERAVALARPQPKPTRLPQDWKPDEACRHYATDKGLDPALITEAFVDYWTGGRGGKQQRVDWNRTWRVWCDRETPRPGPNGKPRTPRKEGEIASLIRGGMSLKDQPVEGF